MKIQELIGWHEDWTDGNSTYKVWFDQFGTRMEPQYPSDQYLVDWLEAQGAIYDISWRPGQRWRILYKGDDGKAYVAEHNTLRFVMNMAVRGYVGED